MFDMWIHITRRGDYNNLLFKFDKLLCQKVSFPLQSNNIEGLCLQKTCIVQFYIFHEMQKK